MSRRLEGGSQSQRRDLTIYKIYIHTYIYIYILYIYIYM